MSDRADSLIQSWKQAAPRLRADTIEYLRGLRAAVPLLAADLLLELAYASRHPALAEIEAEKKAIAAWLELSPTEKSQVKMDLQKVNRLYPGGDCHLAAGAALEELPALLAEKEKWERRYHELAAVAIPLSFKLSQLRELIRPAAEKLGPNVRQLTGDYLNVSHANWARIFELLGLEEK